MPGRQPGRATRLLLRTPVHFELPSRRCRAVMITPHTKSCLRRVRTGTRTAHTPRWAGISLLWTSRIRGGPQGRESFIPLWMMLPSTSEMDCSRRCWLSLMAGCRCVCKLPLPRYTEHHICIMAIRSVQVPDRPCPFLAFCGALPPGLHQISMHQIKTPHTPATLCYTRTSTTAMHCTALSA